MFEFLRFQKESEAFGDWSHLSAEHLFEDIHNLKLSKAFHCWFFYPTIVLKGFLLVFLLLFEFLNLKLNNNKFIMKCFGIDTKKYMTCELTLQTHASKWENFPKIEIFQSGDVNNPSRSQTNQPDEVVSNRKKFGIGWSIKQRCVDYWKKNWPFYRYEGLLKLQKKAFLKKFFSNFLFLI